MKDYEQRKLKSNVLTDNTFIILMMIYEEAQHPYLIKKKIDFLFQDELDVPLQTIYSTIKNGIEKNWIDEIESSENKKYILNQVGRLKLEEKINQMKLIEDVYYKIRGGE